MTVTLADIEAARRTIGAQVLRTPMLPAPKLSALTGAQVWVKYENLQVTNSFKERGAVNKLATLSAAGPRGFRCCWTAAIPIAPRSFRRTPAKLSPVTPPKLWRIASVKNWSRRACQCILRFRKW